MTNPQYQVYGQNVTPSQFPPRKGNGLGVAALVLGIVSLVFSWVPIVNIFLGIITGIIAVVLGITALSKSHKGMGITGLVTGAVAVIVAIVVLAAVNEVATHTPNPFPASPAVQTNTPYTDAPTTEAPTTEAPVPPSTKDFTISLKTTSKQCFGSAGCNVIVEPAFKYNGTTPLDAYTCDITYQINGGDSGPTIATAQGYGGADISVSPSILSTTSSSRVISSSIQTVSCT